MHLGSLTVLFATVALPLEELFHFAILLSKILLLFLDGIRGYIILAACIGALQLNVARIGIHGVCHSNMARRRRASLSSAVGGQSRVDSVQVIDDLAADRCLRLEVERKLLARHKGRLAEVHLAPGPLAPSFTPVNDEVLREPLFSLLPDLIEEALVGHFFDVGRQTLKHELNIVLAPSLALVLLDGPQLKVGLLQQLLGRLKVDPHDGNVECVPAVFVNQCGVCPRSQQQRHHLAIVAERCPYERCALV